MIVDYLKAYGDAGKAEISDAFALGRKRLDRLLFELELEGIIHKKGSQQRPKWGCQLLREEADHESGAGHIRKRKGVSALSHNRPLYHNLTL